MSMAAPRSCTLRRSVLKVVCILMSFIAVTRSASIEPGVRTCNLTENEPQSTFSASHGYQSLKFSTGRLHPRRLWSTRFRRLCGEGTASAGDFSQGWMSIFKNESDYFDIDAVFVLGIGGTVQFANIQDAVDQVPDFNTKLVTIYVTCGSTYVEKVIIPAIKPYLTLQGEARNGSIISWQDTVASAGTLMSASFIVESDNFVARDIPFWNTAEPPALNKTNMQALAIRISGDKAFLLRCNFFSHQDTLYHHQGRQYYFGCCIQGSEDFIFGAGARSLFKDCIS